MSKSEAFPNSLSSKWGPSSESTSTKMLLALEQAKPEYLILGLNAVNKALDTLSCVIIFSDSGSLTFTLPIEAYLKGVPYASIPAPSSKLLSHLKIKKLSCIGIKRVGLENDEIASAVLSARAEANVQVPFGDLEKSVEALKPVVSSLGPSTRISKTPSIVVPPKISKPATKLVKRFFSNLE